MSAVVQVQQFPCPIPAGTLPTAPVVVQMQLGTFEVQWVEWEVPDGPNGQVGFYIASSRVQVFPFRVGASPNWIVTSGTNRHWDVYGQPNSGDWQLVGYNTGINDHTVYVTWGLAMAVGPTAPGGAANVPTGPTAAQIESA